MMLDPARPGRPATHLLDQRRCAPICERPTTSVPPKTYNNEFLDGYLPDKTFYPSTSDRERLHAAGPARRYLHPPHLEETVGFIYEITSTPNQW